MSVVHVTKHRKHKTIGHVSFALDVMLKEDTTKVCKMSVWRELEKDVEVIAKRIEFARRCEVLYVVFSSK